MTAGNRRKLRAFVVGASAGGVGALRTLLGALSERLRTPLIVVLHTAADDHAGLCRMYARVCPLPVVEAQERCRIEPQRVYLAPPGYHLLVEKNEHFSLSTEAKVRYVRPSIDVLFESAADAWRNAVIGVVLTGANDDGARGLLRIRQRGGVGIVQSPDDAEVPEMPAAALRLAGADHVVELAGIAPLLNRLAGVAP
ncbi:MAG TPA: chemotaxis protein CheB [Solimonas sp.]|nr:chemotaxis protein CheB [Solimonas sp.]